MQRRGGGGGGGRGRQSRARAAPERSAKDRFVKIFGPVRADNNETLMTPRSPGPHHRDGGRDARTFGHNPTRTLDSCTHTLLFPSRSLSLSLSLFRDRALASLCGPLVEREPSILSRIPACPRSRVYRTRDIG